MVNITFIYKFKDCMGHGGDNAYKYTYIGIISHLFIRDCLRNNIALGIISHVFVSLELAWG